MRKGERSATTVRGVKEGEKTGCASQKTGVYIYTITRKTLRSTIVDDVSTQSKLKGLIRTCESVRRSTYEVMKHVSAIASVENPYITLGIIEGLPVQCCPLY